MRNWFVCVVVLVVVLGSEGGLGTQLTTSDAGFIEVWVMSSCGCAPLRDATVDVYFESGELVGRYNAPDGFVNITDLSYGTYLVKAWRNGYVPQTKAVTLDGSQQVEFRMISYPPYSSFVELWVTNNQTQEAIPDVNVTVYTNSGYIFSSGKTNASGFFNASSMNQGVYKFLFEKNGFQTLERYINIPYLGYGEFMNVSLEPHPQHSASVEVKVLDDRTGLVMSGARLEVIDEDEVSVGLAFTDLSGKGTVGNLSAGNYSLYITNAGYQGEKLSFEVLYDGQRLSLEVLLIPFPENSSIIRVEVLANETKVGVGDVLVRLNSADGSVAGQVLWTNISGWATFKNLTVGHYTLFLSHPSYLNHSAQVDIYHAGDEAHIYAVLFKPEEVNAPVINVPNNIIVEGGNDVVVYWSGVDDNPDTYSIFLNGSLVEDGMWQSGEPMNLSLGNLTAGTFILWFVLSDTLGCTTEEVVLIQVLSDLTPPLLSTLADITFPLGWTESLLWEVWDANPGWFVLYVNGSVWSEGRWECGLIPASLNWLDVGVYTFTIVLVDLFGNNATDTVIVTVFDPTYVSSSDSFSSTQSSGTETPTSPTTETSSATSPLLIHSFVIGMSMLLFNRMKERRKARNQNKE